ncbi:MAG: tRNA nucleotidyltransferase [Candidatus Magasanikbacteria bacterium CG_4_9_14_0_2_um_filter_42_11]|uniref:tRNA nucleotidyltransferase n=1 Tax=Candidatus Magasanikbacteria bacterium CG_4_9_14_0_2_um_filter_42_11 TaxID=1974643 RepID=A0A2M8F910_9BACT|nr:MAG: tRNA nucleotidyltransferase [Candidatus Magasanikbacteria bacterium CG10_big_fil_rev_8_21_14_0_10_43_9]PIY92786.1 MAG: tRNA nucleotidyltransferase [Candidatus Magasanikbacteria bacterium CG_4_10_14_0_8_um_filter_42_12]PJC52188.1 MAG: tRNA nucleotidyltransferase [Candidatus Magasanikbacteria bacterium CG_4_9_14_0_2_um_filter_42_11]
MNMQQAFKTIGTLSKNTGIDVYVVGGFVRDQLLERDFKKDLDVVVLGSGLEFAKQFAAQFSEEEGRLIEFPDFDTARYVFIETTNSIAENGEQEKQYRTLLEVEFAGARKEAYRSESRKPDVVPATLEEDLSRRDFTVNAMAQQILPDGTLGEIVDPYDGKKDVKERLLRTPLEPGETFSEDPLRMMRAARFSAQLIFEIEKKTYLAMKKYAPRLSIVSAERVQEELMKLLATAKPSIGLWALYKSELFDQFMPEVPDLAGVEEVKGYTHKDNLSHTFAVVDNIAEQSEKPLLRFAGLVHDIAKPDTKKFVKGRGWTFDMHEHLGKKMVHTIGKRLKMSTRDIRYVAKLVRWHLQPISLMDDGVTDTPVRRLIVNLKDDLADLLMLCRADITTGNQKKKIHRLKNYDYLEVRIAEVMEKDNMRAFQSPVRGEEIMEMCGLKPGPTVGKIKKELERAILDGDVENDHDAVRAYFETIKDEYLKGVEEWERLT